MRSKDTFNNLSIQISWILKQLSLLAGLVLTACAPTIAAPTPTIQPYADELIFYNFFDYMPASVLEKFEAEYGITVRYTEYITYDEAVANLKAGNVYDVVLMEHDKIPELIEAGLLAPLDYRNIPNFKNISENFRDLSYDPKNKYTVPFFYGATFLLARTDLTGHPVTSWKDLWDPAYAGKIAFWPYSRDILGMALRSLGYSVNTRSPDELQAAVDALMTLRPNIHLMTTDEISSAVELMDRGEIALSIAYSYDAQYTEQSSHPYQFSIPSEGTILWGENLLIPASSQHKATAELFINFLLRPEISAEVSNELLTAVAVEAARPFLAPEIAGNPIIYLPNEDIEKAEILLPLDPAMQRIYNQSWEQFVNLVP